MVHSEANQILMALEHLKQVELKKETLKTLDAWSYLHPTIAEAAKSKFSHGDYEGAVQDALLEINARLKAVYKSHRGDEKDGTDLTQTRLVRCLLPCGIMSPVEFLGDAHAAPHPHQ